nr:MAG TPA: hypothetical protein [Caudoviricetes sp.]
MRVLVHKIFFDEEPKSEYSPYRHIHSAEKKAMYVYQRQ